MAWQEPSSNSNPWAFNKEALAIIWGLWSGWDCDEDSHKYNALCRACEAEKFLIKWDIMCGVCKYQAPSHAYECPNNYPRPLAPHCYYCGNKDCLDGRFLTILCPHIKENKS